MSVWEREYMHTPKANTFDNHRERKRGGMNVFLRDDDEPPTDEPPTYADIRDALYRELYAAIASPNPARVALLETLANVALAVQTFDIRARQLDTMTPNEPDDGGRDIAS